MRKLLLLLSVVALSLAWGDFGHLLISRIAYNWSNQQVKTKIDTYVQLYSGFYPQYNTYLSAAVWPDKIRDYHVEEFTDWHYIDTVYNPYNISIDTSGDHMNTNVVWALEQVTNTLSSKSNDKWSQGMMIRYLLHLVGDLHQPLHNINFYSSVYKTGDRGGNLFTVMYGRKKLRLHEFWDSAGELYTRRFNYPLTLEEVSYITDEASALLNTHPIMVIDGIDYGLWSNSSHNLAIENGYNPLLNSGNNTLTEDYVNNTRTLCKKQIVKAGYRLAYILHKLFSST
jgi:hypothetical protein